MTVNTVDACAPAYHGRQRKTWLSVLRRCSLPGTAVQLCHKGLESVSVQPRLGDEGYLSSTVDSLRRVIFAICYYQPVATLEGLR